MALSANATKALDQVKMGLHTLYGADYFTEDEWIKIDGLIHKGKYVFTQGPPRNVLEEELMSFDEFKDPKPSDNTNASDTFELIEKDYMQVKDEQIASPASNTSPSESPKETPNATSAEVSDEESAPPQQLAAKQGDAMGDLSEMATPATIKTVEEVKAAKTRIPAEGGLSVGYTQAQLDEVKAFNAGLTKAGQKSRPKYTKEESYSQEWSDSGINPPTHETEEVYADPAPTPHEIRTWASEVNSMEHVSSKASSVKSNTASSAPPTPSKQALVEQFVKAHGRPPKSINDIYQPNNAGYHGPKRVESRASTRTARTVASKVPTQPKNLLSQGKVKLDSIYIAQSSSAKTNHMALGVTAGDQIKVMKHVSGTLYNGMNLRTKQAGQFRDSIFKKDIGARLIEQQQHIAQKSEAVNVRKRAPSVSTTVSRRLDRVEHMNAAEWDEAPTARRPKTTRPKTVAPVPTRPLGVSGLATSRFALLADMDSKSESSEQQDVVPGMTQEEIERLVDDKFDQILKSRNMNGNSASPQPRPPTGPSRKRTIGKEPLQAVTPKTEICWFWATPNKGCRFTSEECRDLHSFVPTSGDPSNLRMGKPTWGALADSVPAPAPAPAVAPKIGYTCYFWATTGRCQNSTTTCKYLHELGTLGIARHPRGYRIPSNDQSRWREATSKEGNEWGEQDDGEGELVLEEVQGWGGSGWGEETLDKYKPPHIKALEDQASTEFSGW